MEERAKQMGWLPLPADSANVQPGEFRGKAENWVPAEKFVELAETSLPHLKGTLKTMERKMSEQDVLLRQQTQTITSLKDDITEFVEFSRGAEQRAYDKAVKELQAKQRTAKEAGDLPAFVEATESLDDLISTHPAVTGKEKKSGDTGYVAPTQSNLSPKQQEFQNWLAAEPDAFDSWKDENPWFDEEPDMAMYADQTDRFLLRKNGFKIKRSDHLAEVAKLVKKKYPAHFGNAQRKGGSPVEGVTGSPGSGDNGKHNYLELPADARTQCDKWTGKDGKGTGTMGAKFTREDYLKSYKW